MKPIRYLLPAILVLLTVYVNFSVVRAQSPCINRTGPWAGFYDKATLKRVQERTLPGLNENFNEVIMPAVHGNAIWTTLSRSEQQRLDRVQLEFPDEDATAPINFYACQNDKIIMPLSSLRFLRDMCLAWAYTNLKDKEHRGTNQQAISNYLSVLKYQWFSGKLTKPGYLPMVAMRIPEDAMDDSEVESLFGKLYSTAIVFILCHELGHIRYGHRGYGDLSDVAAQKQETQADKFALDVMREIGDPPFGGIMTTFFTFALLEPYPGEPVPKSYRRTHPLGADRIRTLSNELRQNVTHYAKNQRDPKRAEQQLLYQADELRGLARLLGEGAALKVIRINGTTMAINNPTGMAKTPPNAGNDRSFIGTFAGNWVNERNQSMPIQFSFTQQGKLVVGTGLVNGGMAISIKSARIDKDSLFFVWNMGPDYFGEGQLSIDKIGKLSGFLGTKHKSGIKNAGRLALSRKK